MPNTKKIAIESELRFASEFVRMGWKVFFPYGEEDSIDLLIYRKGEFKKIQVKATRPKNGVIVCKLRSTNNWQDKRYTINEVDYLALYDYENKNGYLIPFKKFIGMAQISLRINPTKNKQHKLVNFAGDYFYF